MKLKFNIPTAWNGLTDRQLKKVAKLYFSNTNGVFFDVELFKILNNYTWYKFKLRRKISLLLKTLPLSDLKNVYLDFYEKQNLTRFIRSLKINKKRYFAPANRMTNLTIGEFSMCEDLFLNFQDNLQNKEVDYGVNALRWLSAILYTDKKYTRSIFDKNQLPNLVDNFKKVPNTFLFATALSYKGSKDYITSLEKYRVIFPAPKPKNNQAEERKRPTSANINKLIMSVAESGVFGSYNETSNTNVYTFLDYYAEKLKTLPKDGTNA